MYTNLLYLPLFNLAYLFFLSFPLTVFVSFIFIALFPTWHLALVLFSSLCFNSFLLVDIIFGFLCSLGQSIVLYFCWTVLILLMGIYVYVYIQHTFYCCYKPLPLGWAFAVLWSFPFFLFSFFFILFSFLYF